ncbi:MAG: hypothetical protein LBU92_06415 [Prevotellaceae bacterium]|jgi:hypothetical protein|nr:hypothetical protein [Prevotellaceae bacterium]
MNHEKNQAAAQNFYASGVEKRQRGELGAARNDFKKALDLLPDFCEAKTALDMVDAILRFGNVGQFNL